jgi:hypothetical protein
MSSSTSNNKNNNNKECEHKVLSIKDRSCTICGISRYDQLQNKNKLTEKEYQELRYYIDKRHWEMIE